MIEKERENFTTEGAEISEGTNVSIWQLKVNIYTAIKPIFILQ